MMHSICMCDEMRIQRKQVRRWATKSDINVPAWEKNVEKVVKGLGMVIREGASVQAGDPIVWVS